MAKFEDFHDKLDGLPTEINRALELVFDEVSRNISPQALAHFIEATHGLHALGRGDQLVLAWIAHMPAVIRDCGEDILHDCLGAAMKLSSMTSGDVIAQMFVSLPIASRRLGDPELMRGYLAFIHQLSARAARGLRPMFGVIDELLTKLTLSGLRRWANFGAQAYSRDLPNLVRYFALESADSRKVLQNERKGTLFIDSQRRLNFYLRALWGRDFFLRPVSVDYEGARPYIEQYVLHLPDALDGLHDISADEIYRAMSAHQVAHLLYTEHAISAEELSPAQLFFIGLIEDARVEWCAANAFPGLGKLWRRLLSIKYDTPPAHPTLEQLEKFALALNDPQFQLADPELSAIAQNFHAQIKTTPMDGQMSWNLGLELFHVFQSRHDVPSLRLLNAIRIPYRDDNRVIWEFNELDWGKEGASYTSAAQKQVRKYVSVMEMANEVDAELAGDDAQEIWVCKDNFMPYEDAGEATESFNDLWGKEPISAPFYYHEWDYQVQIFRPDWSTVRERRAAMGSAERIKEILDENKGVAARIRQIIDLLAPSGVVRMRGLEDGDEIDLNAAIDAMIAMRTGMLPSPRITMRNVINARDLAVTILLDLSESTNDQVKGTDQTILDITKQAVTLLSMAISGIGDPFAIHGFSSDGRMDVHYYKFKEFSQPFNDDIKARLDGMKGGLSTRMGAALRHAGQGLLRQSQSRKMILLVTDGAPADIDERDPQYLRHDTKKAVEELSGKGVMTYCLTLDANADHYVKKIFGQNNYTILDNVAMLPDKLPALFASLSR